MAISEESFEEGSPQDIGSGWEENLEEVGGFEDANVEDVVPLYCTKYNTDLRGTLVPMAAEVVLLTRMGGTRKVARFFSDFLGKKISRRPIETILKRVKKGEIIVTEEQIRRAASRHPMAQRFVEKAPWIVDPKSEATIVPEPQKPAKQLGKTKRKSSKTESKTDAKSEPDSEQKATENLGKTESKPSIFGDRFRVENGEEDEPVFQDMSHLMDPKKQAALKRLKAKVAQSKAEQASDES